MLKTIKFLSLFFVFTSLAHATIYRVDPTASGNNHGLTWASAMTNLQTALSGATTGDEIWVKAGVYKPTANTDRTATFTIPTGVKLFGGFAGNETFRQQRSRTINHTTLSGDIGVANNTSDNSYHVVTMSDKSELNGFWITSGNADGVASNQKQGAGVKVASASSTDTKVRKCIFTLNYAQNVGSGAAMFISSNSNVSVSQCVFLQNHSVTGGAVYVISSSPTFTECEFQMNSALTGGAIQIFSTSGTGTSVKISKSVFYNNSTTSVGSNAGGGAIHAKNASLFEVENSLFVSNSAAHTGGALNIQNTGASKFTNCTFFNNTASSSAPFLYNTNSNLTLTNVISHTNGSPSVVNATGITPSFKNSNIQGSGGSASWTASYGTDGGNNIDSNPSFINTSNIKGADNVFRTGDDGLILNTGSPSLNAGTATAAPLEDIIGRQRPLGTALDIGAYEGTPGTDITIGFSSQVLSGSEAGGTVNIPVALSSTAIAQMSVSYRVTGGTAKGSGGDYTLAAGSINFTTGASTANIGLALNNDLIPETDETVVIKLSTPVGGVLNLKDEMTYHIVDNDSVAAAQFNFQGAAARGFEDDTSFSQVYVYLNKPLAKAARVGYTITGTATAGTDYSSATSGNLFFKPGEIKKAISFGVINDALTESDETMVFTLVSFVNATIGAVNTFTYTITDNDNVTPVVQLTSDLMKTKVEGNSLSISIGLSEATDKTVDFNYTFGGNATATVDYTTSGSLSFSPGQTTRSLSISSLADNLVEGSENVVVVLSSATNATIGSCNMSTFTITDQDGTPTVNFTSAATTVPETLSSTSIPVTFSHSVPSTVTLEYVVSGTATANVDYTSPTGTLTVNSGTTGFIGISLIDDIIAESDETVIITITSANGAFLGTSVSHTLTISDNDANQRSVFFTSASSFVNEQNSSATIFVSLNQQASRPISVNYSVTGGTATSASDFSASSGTLNFTTGASSRNLSISIINDTLVESPETIILTLTAPGNAVLGLQTTHTLTINDNDTPPTVSVSSFTSSAAEATNSLLNIPVFLSHAPAGNVDLTAVFSGNATGNGVDYTSSAGTITIPAGQTTGNFSFTAVNDTLVEGDEIVTLTVTSATNATLAAPISVNRFITDDEALPTITLNSFSSSVSEQNTASISVSLNRSYVSPVCVNYLITGGTLGVDYSTGGGTIVIPAGSFSKSETLTFINDFVSENNKNLTITLRNPVGGVLGSTVSRNITLRDNDTMPTLAAINVSLREHQSTSLTPTVSGAFDFPVRFRFALATTGTATACSDYIASASGLFKINANSTTGSSSSISIIDDLIQEPNETINFNLMSPVNGTLSRTTATITIEDNDAPPSVGFLQSFSTTSENSSSLSIPVNLSAPFGASITVNYAVTGGTATGSGNDYTLAAGVLNFSAGTTVQSISLSIVDDSVQETAETVVIRLSNPTNSSLTPVSVHTVTINDNDTPPIAGFNRATALAREQDSSVSLPVVLSQPFSQSVTVNWQIVTSESTATQAQDFSSISGNITISSGQTSGTISVFLINDTVVENPETVKVRILSVTGGGSVNQATRDLVITIFDDDGGRIFQRDSIAAFRDLKNFGSTGTDNVNDIVIGGDNNAYIAGTFSGQASAIPTSGLSKVQRQNISSGTLVYVSKFNSQGQHVWTKTWSSTSSISIQGLKVDGQNHVYVFGEFNGTVDLDPSPSTFNAVSSNSSTDMFLVKLATNGDFIWAKQIGGTSNDFAESIECFGNFLYLTGSYKGTVDFDPNTGVRNLISVNNSSSSPSEDAFLLKLDNNGSFQWVRSIGGSETDEGNTLGVDANENIFVSGRFQGTVDFNPTNASDFKTSSQNTKDVFVSKYDRNGVYKWTLVFGSDGADDGGMALDKTTGDFVMVLQNPGKLDVDPGPGTRIFTNTASSSDIVLVRISGTGQFIWANAITGSNTVQVEAGTFDSNGLLYLGGYFKGIADFDPTTARDIRFTTGSYSDAFFARFGGDGSLHYAKTFGSENGADRVEALAIKDTTVLVGGRFANTADLDPGPGVRNVTSAGSDDAFVVRYTQTLPTSSLTALSFTRTPTIRIRGKSKVWVQGGTRPYTISVTPSDAAVHLGRGVVLGLNQVNYTITVTDASDQTITHSGVVQGPHRAIQRRALPPFNSPADFEMVSFPFNVEQGNADRNLKSILAGPLGQMDPNNFMIFSFTGSGIDGYEDLNSNNAKGNTGYGLWMAMVNGREFVLEAEGPTVNEVVQVDLQGSWNMIGNPYNTVLRKDQIYVVQGDQDVQLISSQTITGKNLWTYSRFRREYVSVNELRPGQAAWLFVFAPNGAQIFYAPSGSPTGGTSEVTVAPLNKAGKPISRFKDLDEPLPPDPPGGLGETAVGSGSGSAGGGGCFIRR